MLVCEVTFDLVKVKVSISKGHSTILEPSQKSLMYPSLHPSVCYYWILVRLCVLPPFLIYKAISQNHQEIQRSTGAVLEALGVHYLVIVTGSLRLKVPHRSFT